MSRPTANPLDCFVTLQLTMLIRKRSAHRWPRVVDRVPVDGAIALDQSLERQGSEVIGAGMGQGADDPTDRCAHSIADESFAHRATSRDT